MNTETNIKIMKKIFGYNVFEEIEVSPEWEAVLMYCLKRYLTEREYMVLFYHYYEEQTLKEIGSIFSVGPERIRQIEAKAFRKLKGRSGILIKKGLSQYIEDEVNKRVEHLIYRMKEYTEEYEKVKKLYGKDSTEDIRKTEFLLTPVAHLDLSVRSTNCLCRAGVVTLGDLVKLRQEDLLLIRNLGRRSANEIISRVTELGYSFKE